MSRPLALASLTLLTLALPACGQSADAHAGMPGMTTHHAAVPVSAATRREIDSVRTATVPLGTTGAASAAGYRPVLGWIPTMGVHWVDPARMTKAAQADRMAPSQLMFSRIDGRDSLVGAAYGYFGPSSDASPPSLFTGAPAWHEHADLAPPGQTLRMLHVWFVPSPDGPFAGTNPNLPFWAAGLEAPDSARMGDPAFSALVRRAALALAEVADSTALFPQLERRPEVHAALAVRRDSVRMLVPELRAARLAKDDARWDRAAATAAAQWDAMEATYLASARTTAGRERIQRYVAMLLGRHGEE